MSLHKLLFRIRDNRFAGSLYRSLRNLAQGPGWGAFHRDRIYGGMVLDLLKAFPFTEFCETGTYRGYSTELVAATMRKLAVHSSEVHPETFHAAGRALGKYPNVSLAIGSSDQWLARRLEAKEITGPAFFYLDAHWNTYWPLRDELKHISRAGIKAVIVIDDFEVPGRPEFGYDIDGGGDLTEGKICNLDYIRDSLGAQNRYKAMFPKYSYADAFGSSRHGQLRGHVTLFQNMDDEFAAAINRPFIRANYNAHDLGPG